MAKLRTLVSGLKCLLLSGKKQSSNKLKPEEFHGQFEMLTSGLYDKFCRVRDESGFIMIPSGVKGAIVRTNGNSWHNINKTPDGKTWACDFIVKRPDGKKLKFNDAVEFKKICIRHGINGIGVYPMWASGVGFHLDCRNKLKNSFGRHHDEWGAYYDSKGKQIYTSFSDCWSDL